MPIKLCPPVSLINKVSLLLARKVGPSLYLVFRNGSNPLMQTLRKHMNAGGEDEFSGAFFPGVS